MEHRWRRMYYDYLIGSEEERKEILAVNYLYDNKNILNNIYKNNILLFNLK